MNLLNKHKYIPYLTLYGYTILYGIAIECGPNG